MIRRAVVAAKRVIRPMIPDSVMARWRLHQHSKMVRNNVDIYESDPSMAKRWLKLTPDTYRVISGPPTGSVPSDVVSVGGVDPELADFLGWHGSEVVVRGTVARPSMRGRRIVEPDVSPVALVTTPEVLADLPVDASTDADEIMRAAMAGGKRIGLIPEITDGPRRGRRIGREGRHVIVLSAVPLHDIGGGSRASQIAFELVRRQFHVTFVNRYPSSESTDLGLRYVHKSLTQLPYDRFDPADFGSDTGERIVIVEAPIREFLTAAVVLKNAGWRVIYDLIDDWTDEALGGDWYDEGVERELVTVSDAVAASADDLVAHIRALGRDAVLVPNGVNEAVFDPVATQRPDDLPTGPLMAYHGSLYGSWFDWDSLTAVARRFPEHTLMVIGDARGVPHGLPTNIALLGLKPQGDLAAYLARCDVGLVPFVVNDVTHAVSPLKVYEYLACGLPVAAPPLRPLIGLRGVYVDDDLVAAVQAALEAPKPIPADEIAEHSWGSRLATMLGAVDVDLGPVGGQDVTILSRPPVHYANQDRWIRPG